MPVLIPLITLFLAVASDRAEDTSRGRRRKRLAPPDFRWLDLQASMSDLSVAGLDPDLLEWLEAFARRAGVPPLLDASTGPRLERSLASVPGAVLTVNPRSGFWTIQRGPWLITSEPWGSECLIGSGVPQIPAYTRQRVPLYHQECQRRRQQGVGVPARARDLLAELWLPAKSLRPNPRGLDYDVVQVSVWRLAPAQLATQLEEGFVWLDWDDFAAALRSRMLPVGTQVVEEPGDGSLALRNDKYGLWIKQPIRVERETEHTYFTAEPVMLNDADRYFSIWSEDPVDWADLGELDDELDDEDVPPTPLEVYPDTRRAYHGTPAHRLPSIRQHGLRGEGRGEDDNIVFFSDDVRIPQAFGDTVIAFPWPTKWSDRWIGTNFYPREYSTGPVPPEVLEVVPTP